MTTFVVEVMGEVMNHVVGKVTEGSSGKHGVNPFCGHDLGIEPCKHHKEWWGSMDREH